MANEIKLPNLGEGIDNASVLSVLVTEGQSVTKDDPIIEIESDKATLEVPAGSDGTVSKLLVKAGDTVSIGQAIITIEDVEDTGPPQQEDSSRTKTTEPTAETSPPNSAPTEEPEAEPETDAASESPAPTTSVLVPAETEPPPTTTDPDQRPPVFAAPSVRQFAREIGIHIHEVPGSGPSGRISIEDIKTYARSQAGPRAGTGAPVVAPLPDFSRFGDVTKEPLTRVRRATATNIAQAWSTIPHVTLFHEADVTDVETMRQKQKDHAIAAGGRLTITAILLKVVAAALKANPKLNASVDLSSNELVLKEYINIGVATDTERGLYVPVIRAVDSKNIIEIAVELTQIAEESREGRLAPDRMQGASFSISNLGGLGTGHFTPIVNPPEIAILGVGRSAEQPQYIDGQLRPRLMLPLALSFDHRAIDGADGARFMTWIVEALAQPLMLALEG